jgi:hypothetical protein
MVDVRLFRKISKLQKVRTVFYFEPLEQSEVLLTLSHLGLLLNGASAGLLLKCASASAAKRTGFPQIP